MLILIKSFAVSCSVTYIKRTNGSTSCITLIVCAVSDTSSKLDTYVTCLYFTVSTISTAGFGDIVAKSPIERGIIVNNSFRINIYLS